MILYFCKRIINKTFFADIISIMKNHFYRSLALILILLCTNIQAITAQTEKNTVFKVAVGDMIYTPKEKKETVGSVLGAIGKAVVLGKVTSQHDNYAEAVRASVVRGFSNVRRFNTIDGNYTKEELSEGVPALYADGTIANISTTSELYVPSDKEIAPYDTYKALINITVNVKDAYDDHVIDSHTFNVSEYDCSWLKSEEAAINEALKLLAQRVTSHYNSIFPLNASIIEKGDIKKNKQKEVYIDLGFSSGAMEGMKLTVYSVKTIAGRYAQKELGSIKITEVMGDEISLCKVQSGGKDIKDALDNGLMVVAVSFN